MSDLPLSSYTVLDLTIARAGPTAARLLSDWGANVIKIEPPPTEDGRGSVTGGRRGPDDQNLHRNKRGLTINLKSAAGAKLFKELVAKADIVVENFRADVKSRLNITYDDLKAVNPGIILASISGFGQEGPLLCSSWRRPDRARHVWADVRHWHTWWRPDPRRDRRI